ncbi:MAG: HAD family hydrolase [Bacteroidales bacterium]|nr:HAD family hydrolase [Bacteroidales bacterium]
MKVVFFDRDGVINDNSTYYVYKKEHLKINDGVIETLIKLKENNYEFIVISNQSGISKGIYTEDDTELINQEINKILSLYNIKILEYYYCIHHPEITLCLCRKPSSLLFEKAIARFNIDVKKSWMVGDQQRDVDAAKKVGLNTILIESNSNLTAILKKILNE